MLLTTSIVTKFVTSGAGIVIWVREWVQQMVVGEGEAARCCDEVSGTVIAYIIV